MRENSKDTAYLVDLAARGQDELEGASPQEMFLWLANQCGSDFVIAANMQDAALIDIAVRTLTPHIMQPSDIKILFLDTNFHFAETLGTRDAVEAIYGVNILNIQPELSVEKQEHLYGKNLFASNPQMCCSLRKVAPLEKALAPYSAWVTGLRRVESPTRANAPAVSFDNKFGLLKLNPIVAWSDEELGNYIDTNSVLVNPLVDDGYPSIGCLPCTAKPLPGQDIRSGRWAGFSKTECGLHLQ